MTDGATPGSLPRQWYTEEMVEEVARKFRKDLGWDDFDNLSPEGLSSVLWRTRKHLDAIAPMVQAMLKEQREEIATAIEEEGNAPLQDDVSHYSYLHAARIVRGEDS